ncbi:Uncharacterised protein [Candidatus Burarchaeum australiense]|nr:Uncharacterised protein [Candidatus Burarchaeum australiense]
MPDPIDPSKGPQKLVKHTAPTGGTGPRKREAGSKDRRPAVSIFGAAKAVTEQGGKIDAQSAEIRDLWEEIGKLIEGRDSDLAEIGKLRQELRNTNCRIDEQTEAMEGLQAWNMELTGRLETAEATVSVQNGWISGLTEQNTELREELAGTTAIAGSLQGRMDALEALRVNVLLLEQTLAGIGPRVVGLESLVGPVIGLRTGLTNLKNTLEKQEAAAEAGEGKVTGREGQQKPEDYASKERLEAFIGKLNETITYMNESIMPLLKSLEADRAVLLTGNGEAGKGESVLKRAAELFAAELTAWREGVDAEVKGVVARMKGIDQRNSERNEEFGIIIKSVKALLEQNLTMVQEMIETFLSAKEGAEQSQAGLEKLQDALGRAVLAVQGMEVGSAQHAETKEARALSEKEAAALDGVEERYVKAALRLELMDEGEARAAAKIARQFLEDIITGKKSPEAAAKNAMAVLLGPEKTRSESAGALSALIAAYAKGDMTSEQFVEGIATKVF